VKSIRPRPDQAERKPFWGFALAMQPDPPFLMEPAGWETDGLVVRVRNQLEGGRLGGISLRTLAVGEAWESPPRDPDPLSLGTERTFSIPCRVGSGWAALRLEASWRKELLRLDLFPPLPDSHLALQPGTIGALPRLVETESGWGISTALRDWQTALIYRASEAYLHHTAGQRRSVTVEWIPGAAPSTLVVEYPSTRGGERRREWFTEEPRLTWTQTTLALPDLLEEVVDEGGVWLRFSRLDHQDLVVRLVIFE
jgi:hypothetical protein